MKAIQSLHEKGYIIYPRINTKYFAVTKILKTKKQMKKNTKLSLEGLERGNEPGQE